MKPQLSPSPPPSIIKFMASSTLLEACKPSTTLLLTLLFLPSLLASLIFFSFFSSLLFLPILSILFSVFLLSHIISRVVFTSHLLRALCVSPPINNAGEALMGHGFVKELVSEVQNEQVFLELDRAEVPPVEESEEEDRAHEEVFVVGEDLHRMQVFETSIRHIDEKSSFYEILSFWRWKEKGGE
ncbi:hypothetical protein QJS10_CPB15g01075 [Acorus calamus]|uniref:Uncharacterized protein n=1 Tax=Acorus calamus TaxID=4465 RepID=A0AAV9D4V6_ACOCL|nr:hypothetical protein QJS10_CPB15g01075 [Acorus calamus]